MRILFLLLIVSLAIPASAKDSGSLSVAAITAQQVEIRAGVEAGTGRYKDMPTRTKQELLSRQTDVLAAVDGKATVDELSESQRLQVFNDLEWIEAAINNAESDRMVCTREKTLGSNRKQRVCKTVRQMEAEREHARNNISRGCGAAGLCEL